MLGQMSDAGGRRVRFVIIPAQTVIDWNLAKQIAGFVAGEPPRPRVGALDELPAVAAESEQLVSGYTGLRAPAPLPRAESLGRGQWIDANMIGLRRCSCRQTRRTSFTVVRIISRLPEAWTLNILTPKRVASMAALATVLGMS